MTGACSPKGWIFSALLFTLLCCWPSAALAKEALYPAILMNWMVDGTFHAAIVDKSQQQLGIWRIEHGEPRLVESFRCSTGENRGDKWVQGDMRTPEGAYFFCSVIDGRRLPPKYGLWAFTTDYPNFVDKRRGKNGDGIWLHGRDKPLADKPDSNGCIALENDDLVKVSKYIRLQSTPLIIVDRIRLAPRSELLEQEREIRDFIESWRSAWESQDVDAYMRHYSKNFQSCWLDFRNWKEKKTRLVQRYRKIRVRLGKVYLYRQNGLITAIFTQSYQSESYQATGIKVLYIIDEGSPRIYAEDYRRLVDDPYPVAPLLARVEGNSPPLRDDNADFRIRLVSTDEPEKSVRAEEAEDPRPSAPSRGVVLDKIVEERVEKAEPVALEINERFPGSSPVGPLIVAKSIPGRFPVIETDHRIERGPPNSNEVETAATEEFDVIPEPKVSAADTRAANTVPGPRVASMEPPKETPPLADGNAVPATPRENPPSLHAVTPSEPHGEEAVRRFLKQWKVAWEAQDLHKFFQMYDPNFRSGTMNLSTFRKTKKRFFSKYRVIRVELSRLKIEPVEEGYRVRFIQSFRGDDYSDKGWKSMVLARGKGQGFRIKTEEWSPLRERPADSHS